MFQLKREPICRKIQGMLSEYIDDSIDNKKRSLVESHLASCEACSKELKSLRMTVQMLHSVPNVATPRSFTITVQETAKEATSVSSRPGSLQPVPAMASRSGMEAILAPSSLRWLRPATAVAAILLLVLVAGDFLNFFGHESETRDSKLLNETSYQGMLSSATIGVEGNDTLDSYSDGNMTLKSGLTPAPEGAGNESTGNISTKCVLIPASVLGFNITIGNTTIGNASDGNTSDEILVCGLTSGLEGQGPPSLPGAVTLPGQETTNWPLRSAEIAMGAVVLVLAALTVIVIRQRRKAISPNKLN